MSVDPAWLAHLRHELRTPLNHVIGYSEMLLEDMPESEHADFLAALRRVHVNARVVQSRINSYLGSMWDEAGEPDLSTLASELRLLVDTMVVDVAQLQSHHVSSARPQLALDLARIASAAAALRQLAASGLDQPPSFLPDAREWPPEHAVAPATDVGCVLVVDDDPNNREILRRWLVRDGHQVLLAGSGHEALAVLREQSVDLMLLDMMMPDQSGLDVLGALKAEPAESRPPVLVISAYDEAHSAVQCIEAGAEDYLPKPFDRVLMRARVGAAIERKRLRDREVEHRRRLAEWNNALEQRVGEQVALLERMARLKRFFSPQLAEAIVAGGRDDPLETHRREVTVCFLDLRGFTAFAEASEPEEVMSVLREYHAEMGRLIMMHEGTLERFTGDGMMVFFNDPVPVPNPGERVVRMATEMHLSASQLIQRWRRYGYELGLGIGIAQGYATIGAIGFEGRWDYGAIGSVTNLAARLCGEALPGQTLMSRRVLAQTEHLVDVRHIGDLLLKGFQRPIPAFELIGLRG
ncbi:MAG: response regulator [Ideonella sp.]|nr:response regulator [Ideonella sp.]